MPVASLTVRTDFRTYFLAGRYLSYSFPTPLTVVRDHLIVQDGDADDNNAQSAAIYEAKSATARLFFDVKQKGSGRCHAKIELTANTVEEFHAVLQQASDGLANVATRAGAQNWRDNALPTLTTMSSTVGTGPGAVEATITAANLATQGNETDTAAWIVKSVDTGTLKIGTSALTATAWAAGSNDVIDATRNAYYTPAAGGDGTVNAFKVRVRDAAGWHSAADVQVTFARAA